jgi:ribonuclease J
LTTSPVDRAAAEGLVFLPLGGTGEIGMNLNLYGCAGQWIAVDMGVSFADLTVPGVDLLTPDHGFIAERRDRLLAIVLTHAHEDHIGAVSHLWPDLRCPIYATPFTAAMLRGKLAEADLLDQVPLHEVALGGTVELGPFHIRYISLTHSIPEPNALAIRTPLGTILHTGDWKIDPSPLVGGTTDEAALRQLGDDGVLAMVCDSTNVLNAGESGSEAAVRNSLLDLVGACRGRVAITTFASNVARLETVARVAAAHDRRAVLVGRSMRRTVAAAREVGYLVDTPPFLDEQEGSQLPPDKVLYLCTGSQGETRGAMMRIAQGDHRHITLGAGDTVIFSAKIIPGNEKTLAALHNLLVMAEVDVLTERDHFVHVSGHPGRDELARMYQWIRPEIAVPVHGEDVHLIRHAEFARQQGVPHPAQIRNGDALRLAPDGPEIVGKIDVGRFAVDGGCLLPLNGDILRARRQLMFNGHVGVALVVDEAGILWTEPRVSLRGLPHELGAENYAGAAIEAAYSAAKNLPRAKAADDAELENAVRLAVRRRLRELCGKRPVTDVEIIRLDRAGRNQTAPAGDIG